MDILDGRCQQSGNRKHLDLGQLLRRFAQRNRIGYNHLLQPRCGNPFNRRAESTAWLAQACTLAAPLL